MTRDTEQRVRTTILIPEEIHELGRTLAKSGRRSFSSYLTTLIEADKERASKQQEMVHA